MIYLEPTEDALRKAGYDGESIYAIIRKGSRAILDALRSASEKAENDA